MSLENKLEQATGAIKEGFGKVPAVFLSKDTDV